ncbi:MAG: TlpA family protein disulfide reductase [Pirellulales bacterium]|nr:TlpA family protein disulfide reductase [Pirellulales bacterium]
MRPEWNDRAALEVNEDPQAGADGGVSLEVIDEAGYREMLESSRGQVVLVDFWATWCPPCRKLFPHTVQMHHRFADMGLKVVSVSLDDPEEPDERQAVLEFLAEKEALLGNYISRYGSGGKSFEVFAITGGTVPHFKLYDRNGKLHKTFASDSQTIEPEEIELAIEELLGDSH